MEQASQLWFFSRSVSNKTTIFKRNNLLFVPGSGIEPCQDINAVESALTIATDKPAVSFTEIEPNCDQKDEYGTETQSDVTISQIGHETITGLESIVTSEITKNRLRHRLGNQMRYG